MTIDGGSQTVGDALTEKIATIGENMNIRRFETYKGINQSYVHAGGRIGVLVNFLKYQTLQRLKHLSLLRWLRIGYADSCCRS